MHFGAYFSGVSKPSSRALTIPSSGQISDTVSPSITRMIRQGPWSLSAVFIAALTRSAIVGTRISPATAPPNTSFK